MQSLIESVRFPGVAAGTRPLYRRVGFEGASMPLIYKICPRALWREAEKAGRFTGAPIDRQDGFIHFSTAAQVAETAARHFAGQQDLLLVAVEAGALGVALRYERSRGGDDFPHLYGDFPVSAAVSVDELPLDADGRHSFPAGILPA
jgi:uncharacterized protein (DUF952 family)